MGRFAFEIFGIVILVVGVAIAFGARVFPAQRAKLERWGVMTSFVGIVVCAAGFAI